MENHVKFFLIAGIIFYLNSLWAKEDVAPSTNTAPPAVVTVPETSTDKNEKPDESKYNREKKQYQIAVGFLGMEYIGSPLTLSLGYYLNPNSLLLLRYSSYNGNDVDDRAAQKLRATTLGFRQFFGNSFNVMPTLYYRRNTADYFKEGTMTIIGPTNLVYEDIGMGFRVGNEWQWDNFTMGCDWFGINRTIKELNKKESGLGVINDITLQKAVTITALSFYIGYSF